MSHWTRFLFELPGAQQKRFEWDEVFVFIANEGVQVYCLGALSNCKFHLQKFQALTMRGWGLTVVNWDLDTTHFVVLWPVYLLKLAFSLVCRRALVAVERSPTIEFPRETLTGMAHYRLVKQQQIM